MANINVLDSQTINKIAAGEVVERPASVVKELVENAIDAHASAITVEIRDGGTSLIRITDNGSGIEADDIPLAFLRHSTSKIRSVEDLTIISSLGFRGEALSSIAAVSQVELITKTPKALMGVRYCIDGGQERSTESIGCPSGTTIIVHNLFYNTPARRKFLKSYATEAGYVSDLMMRLALSHPEVSFKFINNNQNKIHTSGNMQLKDIVYNIYGRDITANILEISGKSANIDVHGYIGKPLISRGNRAYENYFINGRYIKSPIITRAIEEAYKNFVMVHKYPFTAFHLNIDTALIDVNVHPTKMEIRFINNDEVYQLIYHTIRNALAGRDLIVDVSLDTPSETASRRKDEIREIRSQKVPEPFETVRLAALGKNGNRIGEAHGKYHAPAAPYPDKVSAQPPTEQVPSKQLSAAQSPAKQAPTQQIPAKQPISKQLSAALATPPPATLPETAKKEFSEASKITHTAQIELFDDRLLSQKARSRHRLIGQVFETYWIVEYEKKLFIIDQHAAHEKVMYERLKKQYQSSSPLSQYLEPPVIISVSLHEEVALKACLPQLSGFGFEIEHFGGSEYAIRAVPVDLYGYTERDLFIELLDQISNETSALDSDMINDRLAAMACKAAVKGNQKLSFEEANALIDQLLDADNPYNCPHGRPTIISMSQYELEKKFKRIQN